MTAAHGTPESSDPHGSDADHHADADDTGHDDQHDTDAIGPIDWPMWGAGVLGVAAAALMLAATVVATDFVFLGVTAAH